MKAWSSIQSGLEQHDPTTWAEIVRQPLYGNRMLTSEVGQQWGTEATTTMSWWPSRNIRSIQDILRPDGLGWKSFEEQNLRRTRVTPALYERVRASIPWAAAPHPPPATGQWLAPKTETGTIDQVFHILNTTPPKVTIYNKDPTEKLQLVAELSDQPLDARWQEVRIIECGAQKQTILDFNPKSASDPEHTLWLSAMTG